MSAAAVRGEQVAFGWKLCGRWGSPQDPKANTKWFRESGRWARLRGQTSFFLSPDASEKEAGKGGACAEHQRKRDELRKGVSGGGTSNQIRGVINPFISLRSLRLSTAISSALVISSDRNLSLSLSQKSYISALSPLLISSQPVILFFFFLSFSFCLPLPALSRRQSQAQSHHRAEAVSHHFTLHKKKKERKEKDGFSPTNTHTHTRWHLCTSRQSHPPSHLILQFICNTGAN